LPPKASPATDAASAADKSTAMGRGGWNFIILLRFVGDMPHFSTHPPAY
jgi:hypothetical protein